ncbi:hypothetical protein [Streptomyces sp. NBC_00258]|uniref:hypothetical protein n=1 Tax=Streptomyces sp. NBC_00258 TaxID=2903642 RepID=UPI002E28763D|nr:hypothetical protein [Streptomyces sp. NBC_00258]
MGTPTVVRWPLPGGGFACPTCGAAEGNTVALDAAEFSGEPSYMQCPAGHLWAEPAFPRLLAGGILRGADPQHVAVMPELLKLREQPRIVIRAKHVEDLFEYRLACPECAATHGLTARLDSHAITAEPTILACLNGHEWAEDGFPSWVGADMIRYAVEEDPDFAEKAARHEDGHP